MTAMTQTCSVQRDFDLPVEIVWDALTDPVLLEGWLADARFDPVAGAPVDLHWLDDHHGDDFDGTLVELRDRAGLTVADDRGALALSLERLPGGARGTSARVGIVVSGRSPALSAEAAHWRTHLEALEDLLRGHPVIWERWDADYRDTRSAPNPATPVSGA